MIYEMLPAGPNNAVSATHLARVLGVHKRVISRMIEKERRAGRPICAISDSEKPGYFLPESPEELEHYIIRLRHREAEIARTRQALEAQMQAGLSLVDGGAG